MREERRKKKSSERGSKCVMRGCRSQLRPASRNVMQVYQAFPPDNDDDDSHGDDDDDDDDDSALLID